MKLFIISLGCDKNLCDSEEMLGIICKRGIEITGDEGEADVIIVNTCAFIGDAKEESINTILELARFKAPRGRCRALIVTGCLAQRYSEEIRTELPEVDAVVGTTAYDEIDGIIEKAMKGERVECLKDIDHSPDTGCERVLTGVGYCAYLKIAEGCDKRCTYCIIPSLRGRYRSFLMEDLLKQAERLAGLGVKELILIAQETTVYGRDLYGKKMLPVLLERLSKLEGIEWIRIMYCYPEEIDDELIEAIATLPKVCHYLDIPIQHCSDNVLKRMGRKTDRHSIESLVSRLRERIPDIALRTTLISGFPGESEEDFEELLEFVKKMRFERLGVFVYSREEGTAAYSMKPRVPVRTGRRRRDALMSEARKIAFENAEKMAGKRLKAIIEGRLAEDGVYAGRTYMDAPDVDGMIFIESERELLSGEMVDVRVLEAKEYDLIGVIDYESSQ